MDERFRGLRVPEGEWERLAPTELGPWRAHLNPARTTFAGVETAEGELVGTWAMLWVPHAEGLWVAPAYRRNPGVARRLATEMSAIAREQRVTRLMTGVMDAGTERLLRHVKADLVPGRHFAFNVDQLTQIAEE